MIPCMSIAFDMSFPVRLTLNTNPEGVCLALTAGWNQRR